VVGVDDLDRHAQHLAAVVFDGHLGGLDGRLATEVGIDAGLVVQNADLDFAVRCVGESCGAARQHDRQRGDEILAHMVSSQSLPDCESVQF